MTRHRPTVWAMLTMATLVLVSGCAKTLSVYDHPGRDLPVYEDDTPEVVLESMQQRDSALTAWRARGKLMVVNEGSTTRLDGIMLVDGLETGTPRLRLRASKLGANAMDLVYADGKAWLWVRNQQDDADVTTADALPIDLPLKLIRSQSLRFDRQADSYFVFNSKETIGDRPVEVWVYRSTRTIHRIIFQTPDGPITTALRYRMGEPAPHLDALRLSLDGQAIVEFFVEDFQPNPALTPAQFKPIPGSRPISRSTGATCPH